MTAGLNPIKGVKAVKLLNFTVKIPQAFKHSKMCKEHKFSKPRATRKLTKARIKKVECNIRKSVEENFRQYLRGKG